MAITFVQDQSHSNGSTSSTTVAATFNSASTSGNIVIVGVMFKDTTQGDLNGVTVKDQNSNSATLAGVWSIGTALTFSMAIYYFANAPSITTVTATIGLSVSFSRIWIMEFSGIATSSPLDKTGTGSGSTGNLSTGNMTTTQANEVIIGVGANNNGTVTTGSGYTTPANGTAGSEKDEYQIVSATGTFNANFGGDTSAWCCVGATFVAATTNVVYEEDELIPQPMVLPANPFLTFRDTDDPAGALFGTAEEDLWINPTAPISASLLAPQPYVFDVQEPGGLFGQPDEDFWVNPSFPQQAYLRWTPQFSFDVQEPGGLFGQPDADFYEPPLGWPLLQPTLPSFDVPEVIQAVAAGQPDEDLWLNFVAPQAASIIPFFVYLPDPEEIPAGSLFPILILYDRLLQLGYAIESGLQGSPQIGGL